MKKIVGILAAAAVLATSVFAADVSAKVKLDGKLINYDGTKEKDGFSAIMSQHNTDESWNPVISMSVSGDNYGASVGIYVGAWDATKMGGWNHGYGLGAREWNIWFKPIDVLKIQVGRINESANQESIDYDTRLWNYDSDWGYKLDFNFSGFEFNVGFHQGQGEYWFSQEANGDANIKGLSVFAGYSADFGRIIAFADFKDTFRNITAGLGYSNTFGDIRIFADAGLLYAGVKGGGEGAVGAGVDFDFKYAKDALYFEAYARFVEANFKMLGKEGDAGYLYFKTKFSYKLDPCTLFVYFKDENFMAKKFAATIKAGAEGSVGAASWKVYAQIDTGKGANADKINFAIPVEFAVAF
jgi:hypothetical protein